MEPVTGPLEKLDYLNNPPGYGGTSYFHYRKWHRQAKPYDRRLGYEARMGIHTGVNSGNVRCSASLLASPEVGIHPYGMALAKSRAWDRFTENASEQASMGETLAEFHQSGAMIAKRLTQFAKLFYHLRKLEFGKARDVLELPRKQARDVWSRDRTVAGNFLEAHLGWEPLVKDLCNAMDVLTRDVSPRRARGRATEHTELYYPAGPGAYAGNPRYRYRSRVQYLADIRMSNPNAALMSALGITNILGTAWALVPYSFVFDWFMNFKQVLEGYNRLIGLEVWNPSTTLRSTLQYSSAWSGYDWHESALVEIIMRTPDLKIPTFVVKPFKGFSLIRGITAMSLLVKQLPRRGEERLIRPERIPRSQQPYKWSLDPSLTP